MKEIDYSKSLPRPLGKTLFGNCKSTLPHMIEKIDDELENLHFAIFLRNQGAICDSVSRRLIEVTRRRPASQNLQIHWEKSRQSQMKSGLGLAFS